MEIHTEHGKDTVDGIGIYWEKFGDGPNVALYIAGAFGDVKTDFHPVWKMMDAALFTLVGMDMPGYGKSRPPDRDYCMEELIYIRDARVARKLMKSLGYERFSVVGHSGGGWCALLMAGLFPECVQSVIAVNAPIEPDIPVAEACERISKLDNWFIDRRVECVKTYGREYAEKVGATLVKMIYEELATPKRTILVKEIYGRISDTPILFIRGTRDPAVSTVTALKLKKYIPHLRNILLKAYIHESVEMQSVSVSPSVPVSGTKIRVNAFDIYWEKHGHGPHVAVFISGLLGDISSVWHPVWEQMDVEKFTCVGLDLPGYGNSRPPETNFTAGPNELTTDRDALVVHKLMELLGYKKFSVVGHSGGAMSGIWVATLFPHLVEKVVVSSAPWKFGDKEMEIYAWMSDFEFWPEDLRKHILEKYGKECAESIVLNWIKYIKDPRVREGIIKQKERVREQFKAPILSIVGMRDRISPAMESYAMKNYILHLRIHKVPNGEHSLLSYLDEFVNVTCEFLLS